MSGLFDLIGSHLFRAIVRGGVRHRLLFSLATISVTFAIVSESLTTILGYSWLRSLAVVFGVIGGLLILGIAAYQQALEESEREQIVQRAEERVKEHPNEPQLAWDLARIKLESYLNRNLIHIRWIFFLTLIVMFAGFVIIGYGILRVYQLPENFKPSIIVTLSGVIVEFIAATFLIVYRSTMEQAREYVNILERINAVGMSVQILESIEDTGTGLRDKTRAEIAKGLLSLYGSTGSTKQKKHA